MRIVCIEGSPRRGGATATIAATLCEAAATAGAAVETFHLNRLDFQGCQACGACKSSQDECVLKDDLTPVLAAVKEADVLVLTSPVYYGDITGQLKCFVDRTYSFLPPDFQTTRGSRLQPGKTLVFVQSQGHPDEQEFADVFGRYEFFFKWYGYAKNHLLRACGTGPGDTEPAPATVLEEAAILGRKLAR